MEARAECIASGNIIALVSMLGARSSIHSKLEGPVPALLELPMGR